jgi:hypothetical protein
MSSRLPAVDPARLAQWCKEHLGSPAVSEIFRSGYLSTVIGLRVWTRAYDARYQHAVGQPVLSLTESAARERLLRAGIG